LEDQENNVQGFSFKFSLDVRESIDLFEGSQACSLVLLIRAVIK
jgi:hypothetical protein